MNRFDDVPASAWYGDAVEWAVEEAGAEVLYKLTGTYGPGGEGYVAIRSREMQEFFGSI